MSVTQMSLLLVSLFMVGVVSGLQDACDCQTLLRRYSDMESGNNRLQQSFDGQMAQLDSEMNSLQNEIEELKQLFEAQNREITLKVDKTAAELATLKDEDVRNEFVGFAVYSSVDEYYMEVNERFVFNQVTTNAGNGYDVNTGEFNVPVSGWYYFGLSIFSKDHHDSLQIMKNGERHPGAFGDTGNHDQGAVSWLLQCTAGDKVYVQQYHPSGGAVWRGHSEEDQLNSFIGFLILQTF